MPPKIQRIEMHVPGHGTFEASSDAVDACIEKYLPTSAAALRQFVEWRSESDFSDVHSVSTFIVILADWLEANWVNDPSRQPIR